MCDILKVTVHTGCIGQIFDNNCQVSDLKVPNLQVVLEGSGNSQTGDE